MVLIINLITHLRDIDCDTRNVFAINLIGLFPQKLKRIRDGVLINFVDLE